MGLQAGSTANLPPTAGINIDIDVTAPQTATDGGMKLSKAGVELLVLTFNCAKNGVDVPVFGGHLRDALLGQDGLPELVVMSLQEIAPLSYSFLGEWWLRGYYDAFGQALNLAAAGQKYTLVKEKNVGMTALLVFALCPERISGTVEEGEVGFGAAGMGNKGAVGVRVNYQGQELTFVATHLAAMEWNLKKRNANWRAVVGGLTFEDPRVVLPGVFGERPATTRVDRLGAGERSMPLERTGSMDSSEEEDAPLLSPPSTFSLDSDDTPALTPEQKRRLQDISIFKPTSHLFVAGDLNYRISSTTPPPGSAFPSFDPASENHHSHFFSRDQLTQERLAGRTFHGMSEAEVTFGPTYKYDILDSPEGAVNEAAAADGSEVPWKFASHRWPAWTDRVLFSAAEGAEVETGVYGSLPVVRSSDHRAVFWRGRVPLPDGDKKLEGEVVGKKKLPVDIDVWAWGRRQTARRRELVVGLLALVWSTKEGAVFLGTMAMVGMGWWWFAHGGLL